MSKESKKNRKKEVTCSADYVVDVPRIIVNRKREISYERFRLIGSVSCCCICANQNIICQNG